MKKQSQKMKQQYYLSIKGGAGTYAVFLAILSSVLAGLVTSCNVQWSFIFIISIILLIIGIVIVAWLNIVSIKYNERYSEIDDYKNDEDRKTKALYKTAVDDFNYPEEEGVGKYLEKKFNKRRWMAIALSFTSIVLIVCNNISQNNDNPTSSAIKVCNCGSNNSQGQTPDITTITDTLSNGLTPSNYQPDICKGKCPYVTEDTVETNNSPVRNTQRVNEMHQDLKNKVTIPISNGCQNKNIKQNELVAPVPHANNKGINETEYNPLKNVDK